MGLHDHDRRVNGAIDAQNPDGRQNAEMRYVCPMHPNVRREIPGRCPECGMELVPVSKSADKHKGHRTADLLVKFLVSLILTVPVVAYSELPVQLLGKSAPSFPGADLVSLVLASVVFFYGGWIFVLGAWREIRGRLPGMMTLISLAIVSAYLFSLYATFTGRGGDLYWELASLITVMLLGHWLEMRAVSGTQGALKELSKLLPDTVEILRDGVPAAAPLSGLKVGDVFLVRPGGKIAADGLVENGSSEVDESAVTGESRPVAKKTGDRVIAGTVNGDGVLSVRVSEIGEGTFLAGVMRLVNQALVSKSRLQILSDRAARSLTAIAVVSGLLTLVVWSFAADPSFAVERMVAVLVVACPHALGLAVPLVASISTTIAARNGFIVKQRLALENARDVNIVLFDKTGTLTKGEYGVADVVGISAEADEVLALAAAVDAGSEHVIAKAVVKRAQLTGVKIRPASGFVRLPGKGSVAEVGNRKIYVGGEALLVERGIALSGAAAASFKAAKEAGKTVIYVLDDAVVLGAISLSDVVREESREAVAALKKMAIKTAMITGDSEDVAAWVARELALDQVFARVLPSEKAAKVDDLQKRGFKVAMVGDGVNDAPALTQADIGIAIGAGTNVAIESAGIVLVRNDPRDVVKIIALSRATYAKMIQNLFWAAGYNAITIPLAAGALAPWGLIPQPALAAALMSLSTVIVAINALFLRKVRL